MKKIILYLACLTISSIAPAQPIYPKSPIDTVKIAVADYFETFYGDERFRYLPDGLNRTYYIYDILNKQRVQNNVKNGTIYHCSVMGDDTCGIYMLYENDTVQMMRIMNIVDYKVIWDFMRRHNYTLEQIDQYIDFITNNFEYEVSITVH